MAAHSVEKIAAIGSEETRQREYSVLEDVRSADGKILLTMDRLDMSDGTIRHVYIPDFLASAVAPREYSLRQVNVAGGFVV